MKFFFFLLSIAILFVKCSKDDSDPPVNPPTTPSISSIDPVSGGYKSVITIKGKNFINSLSGNQVTVNGKTATVLTANDSIITVTVPQLAGTGPVIVTNINGTATGGAFTYTPNVFIGGGEMEGTRVAAKYWKNGVETVLSDTGYINSIFVLGDDVYAGGHSTLGATSIVAIYWKNGIQNILPTNIYSYGAVTSIFVSGNDVYAAGTAVDLTLFLNVGIYWKNGTETILDNNLLNNAALGIAPAGSDIYVASSTFSDPLNHAKLWKNGTEIDLSSSGEVIGAATSIYTSGTDVYVGGSESDGTHNVAKYWKNGNGVSLTDGTTDAFVNALVVSGTDVYAAGAEGLSAKYWKNGVAVPLSDGTNYATAKSIQVLGNDVYVAGYETIGSFDVAVYWKNGTKIPLTDGTRLGQATSISLQ